MDLYAAMPPATPRTTRWPCHGRRAVAAARRRPASAESGSRLTSRYHDAAAPLDEAEVDILGDQRFQRPCRQLLFQTRRYGILGQRVQLARVACCYQHAQVLAAVRVAGGF